MKNPVLAKKKNNNLIYRSTTRRYLLAVLIIALLSTSAYYTLQSALSDSDATAYIVNISGRQRMLSQHIALDAHRFYQTKRAGIALSDEHFSLMQKNISDMRKANQQLSSGVLSETKVVELSTAIHQMYFGQMELFARVNQYLDIAQNLQKDKDPVNQQKYLNLIDQKSEQLLKDLNKAVQQYQIEGEQRLARIAELELFVWLATLIALLLEVLFIFRPMTMLVMRFQRVQERTLANLEKMVESRTRKLEIANKKLKQVAIHDPLTKLKNRLTLESDVERLAKASEQNHVPFALAVIDIDFFKKINDSLGHPAGDYVLKELSGLMMGMTRECDHLYRAGGEEFVLVLNRVKLDDAIIIFEKIRSEIETQCFKYEDSSIQVTISAGIYHSSQHQKRAVKEIIRIADEALYVAKNKGRNCVHLAEIAVAHANNPEESENELTNEHIYR